MIASPNRSARPAATSLPRVAISRVMAMTAIVSSLALSRAGGCTSGPTAREVALRALRARARRPKDPSRKNSSPSFRPSQLKRRKFTKVIGATRTVRSTLMGVLNRENVCTRYLRAVCADNELEDTLRGDRCRRNGYPPGFEAHSVAWPASGAWCSHDAFCGLRYARSVPHGRAERAPAHARCGGPLRRLTYGADHSAPAIGGGQRAG